MPGGHSTLNTVVLGEGISKSKYTPYFAYHSCRGPLAAHLLHRALAAAAPPPLCAALCPGRPGALTRL
jgi:hypothetical protein